MAEKRKNTAKVFNLPNLLTLTRIAMVPPIVILVLIQWTAKDVMNIITAALFIIAALTDLFDGTIARNTNQVTDFGKFLDPIADKMLVLGTLIAIAGSARFSYVQLLVVISAIIILLREFAISSIRMVASNHDGTVISANFLGKIKTTVSVAAVAVLLLEEVIFKNGGLFGIHLLSYVLMIAAVLLTVLSGVVYIKKYFSYIDPRR